MIGEAFHPHSVDVDHRHKLFVVVSSKTECKKDFAIKSISEFAAPRGSSSSKYFSSITTMLAIAGFLGTSRWRAVGDATSLDAIFSYAGFLSLLLVAGFELDVVPERYLEQKLLVTGWLLQRMKLDKYLDFTLSPSDSNFRRFLRQSKRIYYLYNEDIEHLKDKHHNDELKAWNYDLFWNSLHMIGAMFYIIFVTTSILLNDMREEKVAWITAFCSIIFGLLGYLTGSYLPLFRIFRCWILLWNPFIREPDFMLKLIQSVRDYNNAKHHVNHSSVVNTNTVKHVKRSKNNRTLMLLQDKKSISNSQSDDQGHMNFEDIILPEIKTSAQADQYLDIWSLRLARKYPKEYIKNIGKLLVMSELVALLTPAVAMGIQWITALCDGPPVLVIIQLMKLCFNCIIFKECEFLDEDSSLHCILKQ